MRFRDLGIWSFSRWRRSPSWMWSNRKWRRSMRRPRKPQNQTWRGSVILTRCRVMAIWNSPKCANRPWGRSVVGRWSVVNIHTSYTDLVYSSFEERSARGVKNVDAKDFWDADTMTLITRICALWMLTFSALSASCFTCWSRCFSIISIVSCCCSISFSLFLNSFNVCCMSKVSTVILRSRPAASALAASYLYNNSTTLRHNHGL